MNIKINKQRMVVEIEGDMRAEKTAIFREKILNVLEDRDLHVVVDLKDVKYIDSVFLGFSVNIYKRLQKNNKELSFINVSGLPLEIINLTRLNTMFKVNE